jgi:3-oxoacyl-[acyl-carrier protein] reductase
MDNWLDGRAEASGLTTQELTSKLTSGLALGRLNRPEDVAAAVVFLASPAAAAITGQSINVDGGLIWD